MSFDKHSVRLTSARGYAAFDSFINLLHKFSILKNGEYISGWQFQRKYGPQ